VKVLDGRTGKIVATITTGPGPKAIAVNPKTGRVYVTEQTGTDGGQAVAVIDGHTRKLLATIPVGPYQKYYDNPLGLAVNARTNTVYASNPLNGFVYTIDGNRNEVVRSVGIGGAPTALAVGSGGAVFVAGTNGLAVIAPSGAVSRIATGSRVRGVAVDSARRVAYATTDGGDVVAIEHGTASVVARGAKPWGISVDPATGTVVVANVAEGGVAAFDRGPAIRFS